MWQEDIFSTLEYVSYLRTCVCLFQLLYMGAVVIALEAPYHCMSLIYILIYATEFIFIATAQSPRTAAVFLSYLCTDKTLYLHHYTTITHTDRNIELIFSWSYLFPITNLQKKYSLER